MSNARASREHAWRILRAVINRLDPCTVVADALALDGQSFSIAGITERAHVSGRLVVVAVGKASVPMAAGAMSSLGRRVTESLAITKRGVSLSLQPPAGLEILEADHPVPAQSSLDAGRRLLDLVSDLTENDLVLMLISGGGSALVEDPVDGVTLNDLRDTTGAMLRAGATINELNAVRRKLSRIKGGRLARAIAPAKVVNLVVSDVLGNPLQDIASGPTVEPPDVDATLRTVLNRLDITSQIPERVLERLQTDVTTPDDWPNNVIGTTVVADAQVAALTAAEVAEHLGYHVQTIGFDFQGEAREFGRFWGTVARHALRDREAFQRPLALIGAGELTVTVHGDGVGGRNTEMVLAAAREIDGLEGVTIASFATDGDDGSSGFAGGIADGSTMERAAELGIDVERSLLDNDTAPVCRDVGAAIDIGPTGTNVNDLYLALIQGD